MSVFRPDRQQGPSCRESVQGFTLIELMVTVAVMVLMAAIATPSMITLMNSNRLASTSGELASALQLARSEAIRRSARVTICGSNDGVTCANGAAWAGWAIRGRDNTAGVDQAIRGGLLPAGTQLRGPAAGIQYNTAGLVNAQQTLTVCIPTTRPADNRRVLTVWVSGSVRTERANGGGACP